MKYVISKNDVPAITQNAASIGRAVSIASKNQLVANGYDTDLAEYYAIANETLTISDTFSEVCKEEIYQMMIGCCPEEYPAIMHGISDAKITAWWNRAVDIIPADGGKGKAVEKVLAYYGLDKEDAIAFGDGNNDIEMLTAVGWGVAMANASEELKAAADDCCGAVSEDGIYTYCLEHGLLG